MSQARKRGPAKPGKTQSREAERIRVRFTNAQVFMTGADPAQTFPTTDPFDRAHIAKCADGLRPAAVRRKGKIVPTIPDGNPTTITAAPRMYPPCYLVGTNGHTVSFETAIEDHATRERWLEENGLIEPRPSAMAVSREFAVAVMASRIGASAARNRLRAGGG